MTIGTATLRANPAYELELIDRLDGAERELVLRSAADPDHYGPGAGRAGAYGLLRPAAHSGLEPRVVTTDTALLFLTLRRPGPCPGYVRDALGDRCDDALGRLVLDRVLEIEDEGSFRSGAEALLLPTDGRPASQGDARPQGGRTSELSIRALQYAQALRGLPPEVVGWRLYCYGRRPLTPELHRRLPDAGAVRAFLLGGRPAAQEALRRGWLESSNPDDSSPWRSWQPRRTRRPNPGVGEPSPSWFKLYVSPVPDDMPAAIAVVADVLAEAPGAVSFKVGRTADGLTRPDKLVAYFGRQDDLLEAARRLGPMLAGLRPHGVPFTAGVTADGMLSWGVDPPGRGSGTGARSWRGWVTGRLGEYLVGAAAEGGSVPPWRVALERIRLDGVDVETWVPAAGTVR
jgi:hypothetical protein